MLDGGDSYGRTVLKADLCRPYLPLYILCGINSSFNDRSCRVSCGYEVKWGLVLVSHCKTIHNIKTYICWTPLYKYRLFTYKSNAMSPSNVTICLLLVREPSEKVSFLEP